MNPKRSSPRASESRSLKAKNSRYLCGDRWVVIHSIGLILNLCIFGCTMVLYQRILVTTALVPCLPGENVPLFAPRKVRMEVTGDTTTTSGADAVSTRSKPKLPLSSGHPIVAAEMKPKAKQAKPAPKGTAKSSAPKLNSMDTVPHIAQEDPDEEIHIIFSTGCGPKQNWQSYVLYHSIMESGQRGHVTRIASGCLDEESNDIKHIHKTQIEPMGIRTKGGNSRFHLHLTPEFGYPPNQKKEAAKRFKYMNKPYGVSHWMRKVFGYSPITPSTFHDDIIIMLLDPDMAILRPIVNDFSTNEVWRKRLSYPKVFKVQHGFPISNDYLYMKRWYDEVKNIRDVLPANELPSPIQNMTRLQLEENYAAGPPYIATARDFYKIVTKWKQIGWPVQRVFPGEILAEMFSYSWAAAHLNLPHQLAHSLQASIHFEEGFHLFKRNKNIVSSQMCGGDIPTDFKPHILHYCQRYTIGKYVLGKHRVPATFVGHSDVAKVCESPLLAEPPTNVSLVYDFYIDPDDGKRHPMLGAKNLAFTKQEYLDRTAFLLCEMIGALNRAATYFKQQHCGGKANYDKSLVFHQSLTVSKEEFNNVARN